MARCGFMLLVSLLLLLSSEKCAIGKSPNLFESDKNGVSIFVVNHGWHTSIVLPVLSEFTRDYLIAAQNKHYQYLEFSWGDEDFFRSSEFSVFLALKAALVPTSSVLHVVGLNDPLSEFFSNSEIVKLEVTKKNYVNLYVFIAESFLYSNKGELQKLGPGLYGDSSFYRGHEKYFLPKTCNVWTAKALKKAGFSANPSGAMQAETVMREVVKWGVRLP